MMNENILIDTNILIYSTDTGHIYYNYAISIIKNNLKNIFITTKNVSEFVSVLTKINIDYSNIQKYLNLIQKNYKILFPNETSFEIFTSLLDKYKPKGNKVFDIEIVSIMLANKINKIATLNKKDFENIKEIILI